MTPTQVEIEVPQMCNFIVRTTGCSLSEVVDMDAEGNAVVVPAPSSEAFAAEMEKYVMPAAFLFHVNENMIVIQVHDTKL